MSKFSAVADHFAKKAKAYIALVSGVLTAVAGSGIVLPSPADRYLSAALAVLGALAVFQVPNRPDALQADIDAASSIVESIKAAGAPAADAPHPPADLPAAPPAPAPAPAPTPAPPTPPAA